MFKKIVTFIMAVSWLGIIIWFSLQPKLPIDATSRAEWALTQVESKYTVDGLKKTLSNRSNIIKPAVEVFFRFYGQSDYGSNSKAFNFIVRKIGHFTVYFFLGLFLFGTVRIFTKSPHPWTLLLGLLLAVFDELNQFFSANRVAMLQDVLVDFAGILSSVIFITIITFIYRYSKSLIEKRRLNKVAT